MLYINEVFVMDDVEIVVVEVGIGVCLVDLCDVWEVIVCDVLDEVLLCWLEFGLYVSIGKYGVYFEYMGYLLVEMQGLVCQFLGVLW